MSATHRSPRGGLAGRFRFAERGTNTRTEVLGGGATFLTMCYILFVNPAILSVAGVPFDAVAVCTAVAAAITTLAMALATNLPFALAPGLGINAVVAFDIVLGRDLPWQVGMAVVVIEGLIAVILVVLGLRTAIMHAVPMALKLAIGVGIGLFITLIGLREGGVVVNNPATGIGLGDLTSGPALITLAGMLVAAVLVARGFRGAVILGVFAATVLGLIFGVLDTPDKVVDAPGSDDFSIIGDSLGYLDDALTVSLIPVIFALFMTDFFDTVGTAVAVGRGGGMLDDEGKLPNADRLLLVDSSAAAVGGAMGVSSVTTYVESGAGVAEGARTGLASVVTAGLFVLAIFFVPIISLVGQDVVGRRGHRPPPGGRARAGDGRLPDDPDRRGHRLVGARELDPGVPDHRRHPADVLDRRRHRPRRDRLRGRDGGHRQGARDPPADVGDRAVLPGVLRRRLARSQRVLSPRRPRVSPVVPRGPAAGESGVRADPGRSLSSCTCTNNPQEFSCPMWPATQLSGIPA